MSNVEGRKNISSNEATPMEIFSSPDRYGAVTKLLHWLTAIFVVLAWAIPLTGIVLQFARGQALPLLGFYEIASPWIADRAFAKSVKSVHELLANTLLVLAGFHALAALAHNWILQDRTLVRMLPGRHA